MRRQAVHESGNAAGTPRAERPTSSSTVSSPPRSLRSTGKALRPEVPVLGPCPVPLGAPRSVIVATLLFSHQRATPGDGSGVSKYTVAATFVAHALLTSAEAARTIGSAEVDAIEDLANAMSLAAIEAGHPPAWWDHRVGQ